jgi:hypothetical protein
MGQSSYHRICFSSYQTAVLQTQPSILHLLLFRTSQNERERGRDRMTHFLPETPPPLSIHRALVKEVIVAPVAIQ